MAVDLHTHSTASDGTVSPARLIDLAAAAGVSTVAITDHDTLDGIDEAMRRAAERDVRLIPGVELSVDWEETTFHLLVYHLEPGKGPLQDRLRDLADGRSTRNRRIVERLRRLGIDIDHDDVVAEAGGRVVGRPHIAAVLVRGGAAVDMADAFDRFLARGRPAYEERYRLAAGEAITLARASGAVPVVAHPHTLGAGSDDYERAFTDLAAAGLMGIEAHYAEYPPDVRDHLAGIASSLGLIATGGSDFHGSYKPGLELGSGRGDLFVPEAAVDALDAARAALAGEIS